MKLIHYGNKYFDKEKFNEIKNKNWNKPYGGFWTSPLNSGYGWKDWNDEEYFRDCNEENSFVLELEEDSRILKIDCRSDLRNIKHIITLHKVYLDFEKITTHYDAIWLTERGIYETEHSGATMNGLCLYGWDCETVLILNKDKIKGGLI